MSRRGSTRGSSDQLDRDNDREEFVFLDAHEEPQTPMDVEEEKPKDTAARGKAKPKEIAIGNDPLSEPAGAAAMDTDDPENTARRAEAPVEPQVKRETAPPLIGGSSSRNMEQAPDAASRFRARPNNQPNDGDIKVTFHAVVNSSFNGKVSVIYKDHEGRWIFIASMSSEESSFAAQNKLRYLQGVCFLPAHDHAGKPFEYHYTYSEAGQEKWQPERLPQNSTGRLMELPTDEQDFHRYDSDILVREGDRRDRELAALVYLTVMNEAYFERHGLQDAVKKRLHIISTLSLLPEKRFVLPTPVRTSVLDKEHLETRLASICLDRFEEIQDLAGYPTTPGFVKFILWTFLQINKAKELQFHKIPSLTQLFSSLRNVRSTALDGKALKKLFPTAGLRRNMKSAMAKTVNDFLTLISTNRRKKDVNRSKWNVWIYALPYMALLDSGSELNDLRLNEWQALSQELTLHLITGLPEEDLHYLLGCGESSVGRALMAAFSGNEVFFLVEHFPAWLSLFPPVPLLERFVDAASIHQSQNVSPKIRNNILSALKAQKSHGTPVSQADVNGLFARVNPNIHVGRYCGLVCFLLRILHELVSQSRSTMTVAETIISATASRLKAAEWHLWVQLLEASEPLGLDARVRVHFRQSITSLDLNEILNVYSVWPSDRAAPLLAVLLDSAVKAMLAAIEARKSENMLLSGLKSLFGNSESKKIVSLLSTFISKAIKGYGREESVGLCKNSAMINVLKLMAEYKSLLNRDIKNRLDAAATGIANLLKELKSGNCSLEFYLYFTRDNALQNLRELRTGFMKVTERALPDFSVEESEAIKRSLDLYQRNKEIIEQFISCCDGQQFSRVLARNSFPKVPSNAEISIGDIRRGSKGIFKATQGEISLCESFSDNDLRSRLFSQFWKEAAEAAFEGEHNIRWEDLLASLSDLAEEIEDKIASIRTQRITVGSFEALLANLSAKDINEELRILNLSKVSQKAQFLKRFRTLEGAIRAFSDVQKVLDLEKFEEVEQMLFGLQDANFSRVPLMELNEALLQQEELFSEFKPGEIKLLRDFCKSQELVTWVRAKVSTLKELETFLEMASIAAGDTDYEVGQVLVFRDAINGFAPLIFECTPRSSLDQVMRAMRGVFRNGQEMSQQRKDLSSLITEANAFLPWLKDVMERQGSVETATLDTVKQILESGHLTVNCRSPKGTRWASAFDSILMQYEAIVQQSDQDPIQRKLSQSDLDEIRSKLMLITVSEEHKDAVNIYTHTLGRVETISKILHSLLDSGCHLFSDLKLDVYFNPAKKVRVGLDFGCKYSRITSRAPLEASLDRVTNFLLFVAEDWETYISRLRDEHPNLNYYTTEQLSRLSSDLASIVYSKGSRSLSQDTLMLLKFSCPVLPGQNPEAHCLRAHKRAQEEEFEEEEVEMNDTNDDMRLSAGDKTADLKKNPLLKKLVHGLSVSEELALACLVKHKGSKASLEDMQDWCLENEDLSSGELDEIIRSNEVSNDKNDKKDSRMSRTSSSGSAPQSLLELSDDVLLALKQNLDNCWINYQYNIKNDTGVRDYIPFRILGLMLNRLMEDFQSTPERRFPSYLIAGKPNLILCPMKDVHNMALMVYQTSPDSPAPTLSECLICTRDTTREQAELYCKRAFHDKTGKVFTIINAHLLGFNICTAVESLFSNQTSPDFKLVFIADNDIQNQSYLVSAFEPFTASTPQLSPEKILKEYTEYVKNCVRMPVEPTVSLTGVPEERSHPDPEECRLRIVASEEYGNGKTLVIRELSKNSHLASHLTLDEPNIDIGGIIHSWRNCSKNRRKEFSIYHVDATLPNEVSRNNLLFSLAVLGGLNDSMGNLWICAKKDVVLIELTQQDVPEASISNLLPRIQCLSPRGTLDYMQAHANCSSSTNLTKDQTEGWVNLMNKSVYLSEVIQRPYQYLSKLSDPRTLGSFTYAAAAGSGKITECLNCLIEYCPIEGPTWIELIHFTSFLNAQLQATEQCPFIDAKLMGDQFPGLKLFVIQFLLQMAKDFSTRSVKVSDESHGEGFLKPVIPERREWEKRPHPYIMFNEDCQTFSFYGLFVDKDLNLIDERTGQVLRRGLLSKLLHTDLIRNGVKFNQEFHKQSRLEKLKKLCRVIGVEYPDPDSPSGAECPDPDPDPNYELTYDNIMKMLAIIMRFRSNIPVVIMGETGSGKTSLVKFMCDLKRNCQATARAESNGKVYDNMIILKVHGGITKDHILEAVNKAVQRARANMKAGITETVLFFDEANTTNAISTIKTVMCDRMINGVPIANDIGLQFVAAVNPYRKHSEEMIQRLEEAGLGYHIDEKKTADRLGNIPMRRLVYRVREIPESMFPLIWDFGSLDRKTEGLYIHQIVEKWLKDNGLGQEYLNPLRDTLSASQEFMRQQKDECSFVSLRDVNRTLQVLRWFQRKTHIVLRHIGPISDTPENLPPLISNFLLALGVAYYVRLHEIRPHFADTVIRSLRYPGLRPKYFEALIVACQDYFLKHLRLEDNIARNAALKENVWMMIICIELQIPLFLVGKPGSSKSLAKNIVREAMQGNLSYSDFFKELKQTQMLSFQCSPIATAGGILGIFRQAQEFQKKQDLAKFSAVVVLDEVGLAEDSEKMPLKTLHPLLEDGCVDDDPAPHKKVAFIGISNWALDPAKMNRGIFVSRGDPTQADLCKTAQGICQRDGQALKLMRSLIPKLTKGYYSVKKKQTREYFGLRDFYSLIKHVLEIVKSTSQVPSDKSITLAIQRNFGGSFGDLEPVKEFMTAIDMEYGKDTGNKQIIMDAIEAQSIDTRYVLLLTKNNAALRILQDENLLSGSRTHIMYGSSFPGDKEYTHICSNINKIKIAMEVGHKVVLCNLDNLYESLYDALNQNYVTLGGKHYVDLGLGTHRVKCRVHEDFKLILVAEDEDVYNKFPVPLINRLEKHYLGMETLLGSTQQETVTEIKNWVATFCKIKQQLRSRQQIEFKPGDVFVGYHTDAVAAIFLHYESTTNDRWEQIIWKVKEFLVSCSTPDAIIRLPESGLPGEEQDRLLDLYMDRSYASLGSLLKEVRHQFLLVTTSSRLLTPNSKVELEQQLEMEPNSSLLMFLQQFDSEIAYEERVKDFINLQPKEDPNERLLLVQSDAGSEADLKLIECAQFLTQSVVSKHGGRRKLRIVFIIHVHHIKGGLFAGMSVHPWRSFHIDEIREENTRISLKALRDQGRLSRALENNVIPLEQLIGLVLPKAVSRIQVKPERVQKRLDILLNEWKKPLDESEMKQVFTRLVSKQIEDEDVKTWLLKVALNSVHLREGNTFQRSVWYKLQDDLIRPIKNIVEISDENNCLNLLEVPRAAWLRRCFAQMLLLLDMSEGRMRVESTISSQFPFSHIIVDLLKRLDFSMSHLQLQTALQESYLAEPLKLAFQQGSQAMQKFLPDLVLLDMSGFRDLRPAIINIVCEILYQHTDMAFQERMREDPEGPGWQFMSPVDCYTALRRLKSRILILVDILNFDPSLCQDIRDVLASSRGEFRVDLLLHEKSLKKHEPKAQRLQESADARQWCERLLQLDSIHSRLIGACPTDPLIPELQNLMQKYRVIRLFLFHTANSAFRPTRQILTRMLIRLNNNHLKSSEDFDKLTQLITFANKQSIKHHFYGDSDECIICHEDFDRDDARPVLLPCQKHIGCQTCLKEHFQDKAGVWTCPVMGCVTEIDKDFQFEPQANCTTAIQGHQEFKHQLQLFFLECLQRYTFARSLPDQEVTEKIMKYIVTSELPRDQDASQGVRTRRISPFSNHDIDATPVVRSFLLQLLLQGDNFENATRSLAQYLRQRNVLQLSEQEGKELCVLTIYCLQDRLFQDYHVDSQGRHLTITMEGCRRILNEMNRGQMPDRDEYALLFWTAKVRLCIIGLAKVLYNAINDASADEGDLQAQRENILTFAAQVINRNGKKETVKRFLLRSLVQTYSTNFITDWCVSGRFAELMPDEMRSQASQKATDYCHLNGDNYTRLKQYLQQAIYGTPNRLDEYLQHPQNHSSFLLEWKMAVFSAMHLENEATAFQRMTQMQAFNTIILSQIRMDVGFSQELWDRFPNQKQDQKAILGLVYYLKLKLQAAGRGNYLQQALMFITQQKFFPTMDQDDSFEIFNMLRNAGDVRAIYSCYNCGNLFGIGDCGAPIEYGHTGRGRLGSGQAKCPQCGVLVGGSTYGHLLGNQTTQQAATTAQDRTRDGHILGHAVVGETAKPLRDLSDVQIALTRFLLHASMAIQCPQNEGQMLTRVNPRPNVHLPAYLMAHLELNLEQLCTALKRNTDDVLVLLYHVVNRFTSNMNITNPNASLNSKTARQEWEKDLARHVLNPECQRIDDHVNRFKEISKATSKDSVLHKLVSGHADDSARFWFPKEELTITSLERTCGKEKLLEKCPILFRYITERVILKHLKHLPAILSLENRLVRLFSKRIDSSVVEAKTIERFIAEANIPEDEKTQLENRALVYIRTFNALRKEIFNCGERGRGAKSYLEKHNEERLSMLSSASVLFPTDMSGGKCITALLSLLIQQHNAVVSAYLEHINTADRLDLPQAMSCAEPLDSEKLLTFTEEELTLLLVAHSEYELKIECNGKTQWNINLESLERSVIERYFVGRTPIDESSIPKFHFQNESLPFADLREKIVQEGLKERHQHRIRRELKDLRDVCDLLSDLQTMHAILVHMDGHGPEESLLETMHSLHIRSEYGEGALRGLSLKHIDGVICFLTLLRARWIHKNKHNPFNLIVEPENDQLPENVNLKALKDFKDLEGLLFSLHLFINDRLRKILEEARSQSQEDDSAKSLQEFFGVFLDDSLEDPEAWEKAGLINEELENGHAIALFLELIEVLIQM